MKTVRQLKTLALIVAAIASHAAISAAPVTYWFSGQVDYFDNPSNTAPSGVAVGTPFVGRISYDPAALYLGETNDSGGGGYSVYYFTNTASYSFTLYIAGHTISNFANSLYAGDIGIENNVSERDFYYAETGSALMMDGTNMVAGFLQASMYLGLTDTAAAALTSTALPLGAPVLSQYDEGGWFGLTVRNGNGTVNLASLGGPVSVISTNEIVLLGFRRISATTAEVAWPLYASGYTLQSATNLTIPNWQNVGTAVVTTATEHTVTVSTTGTPEFFRLKK